MLTRLAAIGDVLKRYGRVFGASWKERRAMAPLQREADELAFLPAHLELMESPVSPASRWSMRIIIGLFVLALAWACLGKLDIVAVAPGQVVSEGRTKVIQPLETAIVRKILVHDGQLVRKGDLLVQLDSIGVSSDAGKARQALHDARLTELRTTALLKAMDTGAAPRLSHVPDLSADQLAAAQALATSAWQTFTTKRQGLQDTVKEKQAALATLRAGIDPLERYAAIAHERMAQYEQLVGKGYVSKQAYLEHKQAVIEAQRNLDTQRHRQNELAAQLAATRKQLATTVADMRSKLLDERRQARQKGKQSRMDVARTQQRRQLMQLRAPVTGTVQQLAIHTLGGVVTPAQTLMAIVPQHATFDVNATVLNKDIGFVKVGQHVVVKLQSFPYTRYGYLTGTVESISHDAAQDKKLGLIFPAVIKLDSDTLHIDGIPVRVTAGMTVSAEIKTGKRRVIDYLLSPLETHVDEAMRER